MGTLLDFWGEWIWFAGAALGVVTTLVTLVYLLGSLLLNDKMKTWARMELVEVFYSAIIIGMALTALPIIDGVVQGSLGVSNVGGTVSVAGNVPCGGTVTSTFIPVVVPVVGPGGIVQRQQEYQCLDICGDTIAAQPGSVYSNISSCHMRLGVWYLRELFEETSTFAFDIYLSYIKTSMIAEFTINIEYFFEKAGFFTFTPWRGFYTMGNTVKALAFDWAMKLMMLTKFQEVMLRFIATALFPALFVSGAILRTFTFTRRLGGLLLAMAIVLYFIFPAFYAFGALVMLDLKNGARDAWIDPDNEANPAHSSLDPLDDPTDYPNPPIANTMYIKGDIPMIGGSGSVSTDEAKTALTNYEGLDSETYFDQAENAQRDGLLPAFDLSSNQYAGATEEEKTAALTNAREAADRWVDTVSRESKFDKFVTFAWEPNGPVDVLARITFWSVFFALFSVIGTIAGIRSLSVTFGGDIEIAGLTRLI